MISKIDYEKLLKYWLPVFLWCSVIYYLSSIPDLKSDLPNRWDFVFRKISHMMEYGILVFLSFRTFRQNMGFRRSLACAVVFSITYALTDEYHQTFVGGRSGSFSDVFIDSLGIFMSVFLIDKKLINVSIKKEQDR